MTEACCQMYLSSTPNHQVVAEPGPVLGMEKAPQLWGFGWQIGARQVVHDEGHLHMCTTFCAKVVQSMSNVCVRLLLKHKHTASMRLLKC